MFQTRALILLFFFHGTKKETLGQPTSDINHPGNEFYHSVQHRFSQQSGALNSGAGADDDDDDDGGSSSSDGFRF